MQPSEIYQLLDLAKDETVNVLDVCRRLSDFMIEISKASMHITWTGKSWRCKSFNNLVKSGGMRISLKSYDVDARTCLVKFIHAYSSYLTQTIILDKLDGSEKQITASGSPGGSVLGSGGGASGGAISIQGAVITSSNPIKVNTPPVKMPTTKIIKHEKFDDEDSNQFA